MMPLRLVATLLVLAPAGAFAAAADAPPARILKVDRTRSFVDVDVKMTVGSFVARLERWDANFTFDDAGKIRTGTFKFKFADLKTGDPQRDADMLKWLGGGDPEGRFLLGVLAAAPDGQGVVNGNLTFHDRTQRIEFPVQFTRAGDTYTLTGEVTLDYTQWGLKVIRRALVAKVDPEVRVRIKAVGEAVAAPPVIR
jgi:polyisoprenoid-binding protein YceI